MKLTGSSRDIKIRILVSFCGVGHGLGLFFPFPGPFSVVLVVLGCIYQCKDFCTGDDWVDGRVCCDTTNGGSGGGDGGVTSGVAYCFESNN